jgi:hypothetical protein
MNQNLKTFFYFSAQPKISSTRNPWQPNLFFPVKIPLLVKPLWPLAQVGPPGGLLPPRSPEPPSASPTQSCRAPPWGALLCSTVEEAKHHPYLFYSPLIKQRPTDSPSPPLFDFVTEANEAALTDDRCSPSPTPHLTTATLQKAPHITLSFPTNLCRIPHHFSRFEASCPREEAATNLFHRHRPPSITAPPAEVRVSFVLLPSPSFSIRGDFFETVAIGGESSSELRPPATVRSTVDPWTSHPHAVYRQWTWSTISFPLFFFKINQNPIKSQKIEPKPISFSLIMS